MWRKIAKKGPDECWLWTGGTNGRYGVTGVGRRVDGTFRSVYAHRVVCASVNGPIPDGYTVDHLCGVTLCCNPAHLEAVTQRTNLMRGATVTAHNASVSSCPQGHPYDESNTGRKPADGSRYCRPCAREQMARTRDRNASAGLRTDGKPRKALATHCGNGHAFTAETTYQRPGRSRECRTCATERQAARRG